jgi:hypothetical protein
VLWLIAAVCSHRRDRDDGFFLARSRRAASRRWWPPSAPARDRTLVVFLSSRSCSPRCGRSPLAPRCGASRRHAALVGRHAMVVERIANDEGVGCVKLDGEVWTARAYDEDEIIEQGRRVHVVEIRGATALVSEE